MKKLIRTNMLSAYHGFINSKGHSLKPYQMRVVDIKTKIPANSKLKRIIESTKKHAYNYRDWREIARAEAKKYLRKTLFLNQYKRQGANAKTLADVEARIDAYTLGLDRNVSQLHGPRYPELSRSEFQFLRKYIVTDFPKFVENVEKVVSEEILLPNWHTIKAVEFQKTLPKMSQTVRELGNKEKLFKELKEMRSHPIQEWEELCKTLPVRALNLAFEISQFNLWLGIPTKEWNRIGNSIREKEDKINFYVGEIYRNNLN